MSDTKVAPPHADKSSDSQPAYSLELGVPPGPMGGRFRPGQGGCGAVLTKLRPVKGAPGPLQAQGVKKGMLLVAVNGHDVSELQFAKVLHVLRSTGKSHKRLIFRPQSPSAKVDLISSFKALRGQTRRMDKCDECRKVLSAEEARLSCRRLSEKTMMFGVCEDCITNAKPPAASKLDDTPAVPAAMPPPTAKPKKAKPSGPATDIFAKMAVQAVAASVAVKAVADHVADHNDEDGMSDGMTEGTEGKEVETVPPAKVEPDHKHKFEEHFDDFEPWVCSACSNACKNKYVKRLNCVVADCPWTICKACAREHSKASAPDTHNENNAIAVNGSNAPIAEDTPDERVPWRKAPQLPERELDDLDMYEQHLDSLMAGMAELGSAADQAFLAEADEFEQHLDMLFADM